jgi:hypothetical protein
VEIHVTYSTKGAVNIHGGAAMDRTTTRRRDSLLRDIRLDLRRTLKREPKASEVESEFRIRDGRLYGSWCAAQTNPKRRNETVRRVLRPERGPGGKKPTKSLPPLAVAPRPESDSIGPALLWPVGKWQRGEAMPRKPFVHRFLRTPDGSDDLFLRSLSNEPILRVRATVGGEQVGFWPVIAPGECVELPWQKNPRVLADATDNGHRDAILAYEGHKENLENLPEPQEDSSSARAASSVSVETQRKFDLLQTKLREFTESQIRETEKILPVDLDAWGKMEIQAALEVRYVGSNGTQPASLRGVLCLTRRLNWFRFIAETGDSSEIY